MHLSVVGINNESAPITIREKLAISAERLPEALLQLRRYSPNSLILSTCNRTEIYAAAGELRDAEKAAVNFLRYYANVHDDILEPCIYILSGMPLVEHLFRVACGLNSLVIGEYEVLGQVRQALMAAENTGMANLPLRHIFYSAIRAGRKAREETGISKYALSVSSIAINRAMDIVSDIRKSKLIVIGAGEAGRLAARVAADRGASNIVIMSRKEGNAARLTRQLGGRPAGISRLPDELIDADIVIACAASPHAILHFHQVFETMRERVERPMIIIDIAIPRNVEPGVGNIKGVHLCNIDDLNSEADANRTQRETEITAVERMIQKEVDRLSKWWEIYNVRPAIKTLMAKAEKIRSSQYSRTLKKLTALTEEEKRAVELLTTSIVDKILRDPILYLKSDDDGHGTNRALVVRQLFRLDGGEE